MPTIKKRGTAPKINQEQEILTLAHRITPLIDQYRKPLIIAAAIIVIVIVGMTIYSSVQASQEEKASPLASTAYEFYNPATGNEPDFQKALDAYRTVITKYPNTLSGAIARYYAANCLANLGRADEALKEYRELTARSSADKTIRGLAHQRIAYLMQAAGKKDEAKKSFEQAESLAGPGIATAELARMYDQEGNAVEAQKKYKIVSEKMAGTAMGVEAMGKVQSIAPAPTAPAAAGVPASK